MGGSSKFFYFRFKKKVTEQPEFVIFDEPPFRHTHLTEPVEQTNKKRETQDSTPPHAPPPEQHPVAGADAPVSAHQPNPGNEPAPEPKKTVKAKKGTRSSNELRNMNFKLFGFKNDWGDHLGQVMIPFSMMVFGKPGSGKSTYCIKLAHHCAANMGKNVLYVAAEEGFGPTMKEKFDRLNAYHDNLHLTDEFPQKIDKDYDILFIDSVHSLEIGPEQMDKLIQQVKDDGTALVFIFHSTKEGSYRGATTNEHLIDISTRLEHGLATHEKNRYGGTNAMYVFDTEE